MSIVPFTNSNLNANIQTIHQNDQVYFKGKDVAQALGYVNTTQAIIQNVENDDKVQLFELLERPVWKTTPNHNDKKAIWILLEEISAARKINKL